jgi:hypothetical protein
MKKDIIESGSNFEFRKDYLRDETKFQNCPWKKNKALKCGKEKGLRELSEQRERAARIVLSVSATLGVQGQQGLPAMSAPPGLQYKLPPLGLWETSPRECRNDGHGWVSVRVTIK